MSKVHGIGRTSPELAKLIEQAADKLPQGFKISIRLSEDATKAPAILFDGKIEVPFPSQFLGLLPKGLKFADGCFFLEAEKSK